MINMILRAKSLNGGAGFYFHNIQISTMQKRLSSLIILGLLLLTTISMGKICKPGQVIINQNCIDCKQLSNIDVDAIDMTISSSSCPCNKGFLWSEVHSQCIPQPILKKTILSNVDKQFFSPNDASSENEASRMLQTIICNNAKGFIRINNLCVNCRVVPNSLGVTLSSNACACLPTFISSGGQCVCPPLSFFNQQLRACIPCTSAAPNLRSKCYNCTLPFANSAFGCINCMRLKNGNGTTSCCATGYYFDYNTATCRCNNNNLGYYIDPNGVCTLGNDINGQTCINTYVNTNYQCVWGGAIPNFSTSNFSCNTGFTLKTDISSNQVLSCACSTAAGYYLDGTTCKKCSDSPPSGVTSANCQSCVASSNLYKSNVECIYCPSVANSFGSASANGCDCRPNYYWNINTGKCECDFTLGFINFNGSCFNCNGVANVALRIAAPNACTCKIGYVWAPATQRCVCDILSPGSFLISGVCYSCIGMLGSSGIVAAVDNISCICVSGFFWNYGTSQCQCDSTQNFVNISGLCIDCKTVANSNGLGLAKGCVCINGYQWSNSLSKCVCPTGSYITGSNCVVCGVNDTACGNCTTPYFTNSATCYFCGYRNASNGNLINGTLNSSNTNCVCPTGQIFSYSLGMCVCDWKKFYVTSYSATGSGFTCTYCPYTWVSNTSQCACGANFLYLNSQLGVCTLFNKDPNSNIDSNGSYVCKPGFSWSETSFPFRCVQTFSGGNVLAFAVNNATTPTSYSCSFYFTNITANSSLLAACLRCDPRFGFLLLSAIDRCFYCPSAVANNVTVNITQNIGFQNISTLYAACTGCGNASNWNPVTLICDSASNNGSACDVKFLFNPYTSACDICDPVFSVTIGSTCTSCIMTNSTGYAASSSACACVPGSNFTSPTCSEVNYTSCNTNTSIIIGTICFLCPNDTGGIGSANNSVCQCLPNFIWVPTATGGSCQCNTAVAFISSAFNVTNQTCSLCSSINGSTGAGNPANNACFCANGFVWNAVFSNDTNLTTYSCICDSTVQSYLKSDGLCVRCSQSIDPNFNGSTNSSCTCGNGFTFTVNGGIGQCVCNAPSYTNSAGQCISCTANNYTQAVPDSNGGCLCNFGYVWSATNQTCVCDTTTSIISSGGYCFSCVSNSDPNIESLNSTTACNCKNSFTFTPSATGGACTCDFNISGIFNGTCSFCNTSSCSNCNGTADTKGACLCNGGYIWDQSVSNCTCGNSTVSGLQYNNNSLCFLCSRANDPNFNGQIVGGGACACVNGYQFMLFSNGTGGNCQCTGNSFILPNNGICFTCPVNDYSSGAQDFLGGCVCLNNYVWDPTSLSCVCNQATSVSIPVNSTTNVTKCVVCGALNSYTTVPLNTSVCTCSSKNLVWNRLLAICDCGTNAAFVVTGNTFVCVNCTAKANSNSKNTSTSCSCVPPLTWNPTTLTCDCGPNATYIGGACIPCGAANFAIGANTKVASTCQCASGMTWSAGSNACTCSAANSVIFAGNGTFSCKVCNRNINAVSTATLTSCTCVSSQFRWVNNVGCVCNTPNSVVVTVAGVLTCIQCTIDIGSTGLPAPGGTRCQCLGNYTWSTTTNTCGCSSTSATAFNIGNYYCSPCTAVNNAKTPLIQNGSRTRCTCASNMLRWYDQGYCGCPDIVNQVITGSGATTNCVTCDISIYSTGKTSPNSTTCKCISSALTFNNGVCDCGANKAFIVIGLSNYTCINCVNSAAFLKAKISSTACSCVSTSLFWNPTTGTCGCNSTNLVIVGTGDKARCYPCSGQFVSGAVNGSRCSCLGTGLVFTSSFNTSNNNTGSCGCAKNSILSPLISCITCSVESLTSYECKCSGNSFWNSWTSTCQLCSNITNAEATGGNSLSCKCKTGYIWDVMTLTCIVPCISGTAACMNCNFPLFTLSTGAAAVTNNQNPKLSIGSVTNIQSLLAITTTNYNSIKNFMCACVAGYRWDYARLRCYPTSFPFA